MFVEMVKSGQILPEMDLLMDDHNFSWSDTPVPRLDPDGFSLDYQDGEGNRVTFSLTEDGQLEAVLNDTHRKSWVRFSDLESEISDWLEHHVGGSG